MNINTFMKRYKGDYISLALACLVYGCATLTIGILVFLLAYILLEGIPNLSLDMFAWTYTSENVSMMPAIINTIVMTLLALIIALPLGLFAAIYLVEYATKGNKLVTLVRITAETLSGIPSIVYGLFGFLLFVLFFGWGYSILAGAFTMAIMILPLIMRTTEEALKSVPDSFSEGSYGLGAGKVRTIFKIVLPSAIPGYPIEGGMNETIKKVGVDTDVQLINLSSL